MDIPAAPFDAATIAAMVAFELDPGHSDLDNEQPIAVLVHGRFRFVSLGDIRKAKRDEGAS